MIQEEVQYRLPQRMRGVHPGFHRSRTRGAGYEFREHEYLLRAPDARRLDLQASLKNPMGDLLVRVYNQRSSIPLHIVADVSASMGTPVPQGKLPQLKKLIQLLAFSAQRGGDRFGFVGCAEQPLAELHFLARRNSGSAPVLAALQQYLPHSDSAAGLLLASRWLGTQPGLVFLVSDFYINDELLNATLASLRLHYVVPVMLCLRSDIDGPRGFGLAQINDSETGEQRLLFMRPSLRKKMRKRFQQHRLRVEKTCQSHGLTPLLLTEDFTADDVSHYFFPRVGGKVA